MSDEIDDVLKDFKGVISDLRLGIINEYFKVNEDEVAIENLIDAVSDEEAVLSRHSYDKIVKMATFCGVLERCSNIDEKAILDD